MNHPAPRWRALRKERTGKPHERTMPNPRGKNFHRGKRMKMLADINTKEPQRNPNRRRNHTQSRRIGYTVKDTQVTLYHYTRILYFVRKG